MGSLNDIKNSMIAFDPKIVVFVEAESDRIIFGSRLFSSRNDRYREITFRVAENAETGLPQTGCASVIKQVEARHDDDVIVFGIVDRDATLREATPNSPESINLVLENNNEEFKSKCQTRFDGRIYFLVRWEIENYLILEPELTEKALANLSKKGPRRDFRKTTDVVRDLISHAYILLPAVAANIARHLQGKPKVGDKFGLELKSEIDMISTLQKNKCSQSDIDTLLPRLKAFSGAESEGSTDHWKNLNRIVDGKMLFERLFRNCDLDHDNVRAHLATQLCDSGMIDSELHEMIDFFIERARKIASAERRVHSNITVSNEQSGEPVGE